jgi:hypothetical protein
VFSSSEQLGFVIVDHLNVWVGKMADREPQQTGRKIVLTF